MNKKIIKQLWNERYTNLWIYVELLLVSVVLWYVVDLTYVTLRTYFEPRGFDISNTYLLKLGVLTPKSPEYQDTSVYKRAPGADMLELVDRLRRFPDVEAVSISLNSYPYNGSNNGLNARLDTMSCYGIFRQATPDFFRVFRYEGANGETPEQLATLLDSKPNAIIAGENLMTDYKLTGKDFINKEFYMWDDTTRTYEMVAVTKPVRYCDFMSVYDSKYIIATIPEASLAKFSGVYVKYTEICFRTKDGAAPGFLDRLRKASNSQFRVGNLFIRYYESFDDTRSTYQQDDMNEFRKNLCGISFLLVNIFLGLLGTFWFRTQRRRSEVALHISFGSSRRQVFGRLMSEGLFLLVLATIPALIIDFNLAYFEFTASMDASSWSWPRLAVTTITTFLLMALMIMVGIWYPARQAMRVDPATALREE